MSDSTDDTLGSAIPESDTPHADDALDAWLADDTVVALEADEPVAEPSPWKHLEPVSAWLLRVALVLIIVVLSLAAAMVIFFATTEKAPRTMVERDIAAAELAVQQRPSDTAAWQSLAYAYARGGRHDEAIAAVRRGRRANKSSALVLTEAEVLRAAGRYSESVRVYDEALDELSREESAAAALRAKQGIAGASANEDLIRGFYGRGLARQALKDKAGAIQDIRRALEMAPGQASMHVTLGDLYAASGNKVQAAAEYNAALMYVPDYDSALLGLKRLKEAN